MARVLLVAPLLSTSRAAPLLGQQMLAAALLARGHDVRLRVPPAADAALQAVAAEAAAWAPHVIGLTLFTATALEAYALGAHLRPLAPRLVAGGPHATACPDEALARGFDAVVRGEGEQALPALVEAWGRGEPCRAPGVVTTAGERVGACVEPDLDALPPRTLALTPEVCGDALDLAPLGLMASRGCPGTCAYCAGAGRRWRPRSPERVVAEMRELLQRHGVRVFPFWDDAFAAGGAHLVGLCDAVAADPLVGGLPWTCQTPADTLDEAAIGHLAAAGCVALDVGVESGDPGVLAAMGRRVRPADVLRVVRAAKAHGLTTIVNVMAGFPGEGAAELDRTLALLAELAPHVDVFSAQGVVVPWPGTALYQRHHRTFGFTEWWLDPARRPRPVVGQPPPDAPGAELDPALAANFFRLSDRALARVEAVLHAKAAHNGARVAERMAGR